jgi:hypothetical protein
LAAPESTVAYVVQQNLSPEEINQIEEDAIEAIQGAVVTGPRAAAEVYRWYNKIREHQSDGRHLTVLEHTALSVILKSGFLDNFPDGDVRAGLERTLIQSWIDLAGPDPGLDRLNQRLPRWVLATATRQARVYHAASFQSQSIKNASHEAAVGADYVPGEHDFLVGVGLLAFSFTATGCQLLAGLVAGYLVASLADNLMHHYAGHEGHRVAALLRKGGWFTKWAAPIFDNVAFGHLLHHKLANEDYSADPQMYAKEKVDKELEALGYLGQKVKDTEYGRTLSWKGVLVGLAAAAPVYAVLTYFLGATPIAAAGILAPSLLYVSASKYLHPDLHPDRDSAMASARLPMRMFLGGRFAEMTSRLHYGHHAGRGGNYNLVFGADALMSLLRKPNLKQILRMRDRRLIGACWGEG